MADELMIIFKADIPKKRAKSLALLHSTRGEPQGNHRKLEGEATFGSLFFSLKTCLLLGVLLRSLKQKFHNIIYEWQITCLRIGLLNYTEMFHDSSCDLIEVSKSEGVSLKSHGSNREISCFYNREISCFYLSSDMRVLVAWIKV